MHTKMSESMINKIKIASNNLRKIKVVVSDVDGVLTDGKIYLSGSSEEMKAFCTRDALRMEAAMRSGLKIVWFTGRKCRAVIKRSTEIQGGIYLLFKAELFEKKINLLDLLVKKYSVKPEEILYIGDDWNDLNIMINVGVSVTPRDGSYENKNIATIITKAKGGEGVMAEVLERVMKAKGTWNKYVKSYVSEFIY